jgi:hypothetical protein
MARVYPDRDELACLTTSLNVGERQVLDCLASLDDEWIIYVQPRLGLDQPDFITVHRTFGVCAVEVKDWTLGAYRQDDAGRIEIRSHGGWKRTDEAPRYQAHRYRGAIHDRLLALTDETPEFAQIRGIVVMPRCTTVQANGVIAKSRVQDAERWIEVYGYDDLQHDPALVLTGSRNRSRETSPQPVSMRCAVASPNPRRTAISGCHYPSALQLATSRQIPTKRGYDASEARPAVASRSVSLRGQRGYRLRVRRCWSSPTTRRCLTTFAT